MAHQPFNQADRVLRLARRRRLLGPRDLECEGIPRVVLTRLVARGALERRGRGLYALPETEESPDSSLAMVARFSPRAVLCLLSALRFHELTTQNPFEVWIMLDRKARKPSPGYPPLRVVRASGDALRAGVEVHAIEGERVQITTPAKTVADCFKYRSTVGMDVALEALRDCWRQRKATMDEIDHYARIDRVATVMRPCLDAVV